MATIQKNPTMEQIMHNMKNAKHECSVLACLLIACILVFFGALCFLWAYPATFWIPLQFVLLYVPALCGLHIWNLFNAANNLYMKWCSCYESMTTPIGGSLNQKEKEND